MADHPYPPHFQLPIQASGLPISVPLKGLGNKNLDTPLLSDPLDLLSWPQTRELAKNHTSNPFNFKEDLKRLEPSLSARPKVQVGPQSALIDLIFQPKLGIKVVK